jgi:heterodisulfide reductase subunit A
MSEAGADGRRIGFYICHCGTNIAATVDVEAVAEHVAELPGVAASRHYTFMCSQPGQDLIASDIRDQGLDRVVVAACSPMMHERTFRGACEAAGLNRYLFQMANVREQCAWVHTDRGAATDKAKSLSRAAVRRVAGHEPLATTTLPVNPDTLVVGAGISGIQAALDLAEAGHQVYLVERESTIGGNMARFDKTFPTLDCASCILTPKMTSVAHRKNVHILTQAQLEEVGGFAGGFAVKVRRKARYVDERCTACQACEKVCPVEVPNAFDLMLKKRTAIHKAFPQAVPNTYLIDKQERPPCREACPIGQEAAGYVALIAQGRFAEAAELIRMRNPLPVVCGRVCYHPCEAECNRGFVDEPVAIQHLKRFALDWQEKHSGGIPGPAPSTERRAQKVAIVGSGPAGLACAHDLAARGYRPTVFERHAVLGGMLALGIPRYRLPRERLLQDVDFIRRMGVEFRTGVEVGRDVSLDALRARGYAAFFIATGAHQGVPLEVPGEPLAGVVQGVEYLRRHALGIPLELGRSVAVVGGGNTAVDAARTALREGAERVSVLYRRSRAEMPAVAHEIEDAETEGVRFVYLRAPVEVLGEAGRVTGLRCVEMTLGEADASGRRRPVPVAGSEHTLAFDAVIVAIGQRPELHALAGDGLRVDRRGTLEVNRETFETNLPDVFAGGDVVFGPATVIAAMGAGKRAAEAIDKHLRGEPLADFATHMVPSEIRRGESFRPHPYAPPYAQTARRPRQAMPKLDAASRARGWEEVELGLTEEQARDEAQRCLHCGVCVDCFQCVKACQPGAIDHAMKDEVLELAVGQILVSTGYDLFDPRRMAQYGYGRLPNVVTSLEFERMLASTGPSGGRVQLADGREPRAVAIVHCVGSRDENYHRYCSRVCCMYALKFAHLVRDRTRAEVYEFYIDMRAFGKGYEEFYSRVLDEGANVIRGKVAEVVAAPEAPPGEGHLIVRAEDTLLGKQREVPVDMVVLCCALEPAHGSEALRRLLHLSQSPDGFLLERHPKLDPTGTASDGIYVAGCAQGPKDIPDSVAQASAAASRMLGLIARGEIAVDPLKARVEAELCGGCRVCGNVCPYNAVRWVEERKVAEVLEALCKGCGTCVAACPAGAITGTGFSDEQIYAEVEGLLGVTPGLAAAPA